MHYDDQQFFKDVYDELANRVKVVIDWDGYQSANDEEKKKYFEALVETEGVKANKFLGADPWTGNQPLLDQAKKQVKDLLTERTKSVVTKMPKQIFDHCKTSGYFDRLSKQIEMNNKDRLSFLVEDLWFPH